MGQQARRGALEGSPRQLAPVGAAVLILCIAAGVAKCCEDAHALALDQYLSLELLGRLEGKRVGWAGEKGLAAARVVGWQLELILAEDLEEVLGDDGLLLHAAVHLEREDDRVRRALKAKGSDGTQHVDHAHRCDPRVLVRDLGLAALATLWVARPVEAVELDAAAAHQQRAGVHVDGRRARELPRREVGVVRRRDEVLVKRQAHVLGRITGTRVEGGVELAQQQPLQIGRA